MSHPFPWHLYIFGAYEFLLSLSSFTFLSSRNVCTANCIFGAPCNAAEELLLNYNGILLLYVSILFLILINHSQHENSIQQENRRLSLLACFILLSNLVTVIMFGSQGTGGVMTKSFHVASMLVTLILLSIVLSVNMGNDTQETSTTASITQMQPITEKLGFNVKGFLILYSLFAILSVFINSDFTSPKDVFLDPSEYTGLANALWFAFSVLSLQVFGVYVYAVVFGTVKLHEVFCVATAILSTISSLVVYALRDKQKEDVAKDTAIQNGILVGIALLAVARSRLEGRVSHEYEPV